ncbi:MAG: flagellar hook-associated protein FlgL [Candidatus Paceibacteria bacterium]|jgi:flagellar hook-associated protein 3 FlgL
MINQTQQTLYRLSNLDAQQQKVSYQMSTGKILQQGSDDSLLYSREILVDDKIRTFEGLKTQVERTNTQNKVADSSMSEIKKILEFVKAELIKANTATTSEDGLKAIAANLSGMKQNLLDLANTQAEGEYVFSGSDSAVKPFEVDSEGNVTYVGNNKLRRVAVEEGSYRERGVTGLDMMMYPSSTAYKGETLTFNEKDRIIDQDGNEWKFIDQDNADSDNNITTNVEKDKLYKFDLDGNLTADIPLTVDGTNAPVYTIQAPAADGTKFEAKTNIFNIIDDAVDTLKLLDSDGNSISLADARTGIANVQNKISKAFDSVNVSHAELGGRNKVFEVSLERLSSKLTHYNILSQELGAANLSKVAMEAKALELTYTALYSTINKMNQLSLVNFIN